MAEENTIEQQAVESTETVDQSAELQKQIEELKAEKESLAAEKAKREKRAKRGKKKAKELIAQTQETEPEEDYVPESAFQEDDKINELYEFMQERKFLERQKDVEPSALDTVKKLASEK
jgi:hypothetical protein